MLYYILGIKIMLRIWPTECRCVVAMDYCYDTPCKNNATCTSNSTTFYCICAAGFGDSQCRTGNQLIIPFRPMAICAAMIQHSQNIPINSWEKILLNLENLWNAINKVILIDHWNKLANIINWGWMQMRVNCAVSNRQLYKWALCQWCLVYQRRQWVHLSMSAWIHGYYLSVRYSYMLLLAFHNETFIHELQASTPNSEFFKLH